MNLKNLNFLGFNSRKSPSDGKSSKAYSSHNHNQFQHKLQYADLKSTISINEAHFDRFR